MKTIRKYVQGDANSMREKIKKLKIDVEKIPASDHQLYINENNYIGYIDNHMDGLTVTGIESDNYDTFNYLINELKSIAINDGYTHIYINNYVNTDITWFLKYYGFEHYTDELSEFILNIK